MKKYITPALRVADINNGTLLAGSDPTFDPTSATDMNTGSLGARDRDFGFDFSNEEESVW